MRIRLPGALALRVTIRSTVSGKEDFGLGAMSPGWSTRLRLGKPGPLTKTWRRGQQQYKVAVSVDTDELRTGGAGV